MVGSFWGFLWKILSNLNFVLVRLAGESDERKDWETVNEVKRLLHQNNIHSTTIQLEHDDASLDSCDEHCSPNRKEKCCHAHPKCSHNEITVLNEHEAVSLIK